MFLPVTHSADLQRIAALPRRRWSQAPALAESWSRQLLNADGAAQLDAILQLSPGPREAALKDAGVFRGVPLRMNPTQAAALLDFVKLRGLSVSGPVGIGKTLLGWLLALVGSIYHGSERPIVMVPGSILDDTRRAHALFARVWRVPARPPAVLSYETLGAPSGEWLLCDCALCTRGTVTESGNARRPDLLIGDESDLLRNPDNATARRWNRYITTHRANVAVVTMTGTPVRKTLRNMSAHLDQTLGPARSPLPADLQTLQHWCDACDETPRDGLRAPAGALLTLENVDPAWHATLPADEQLEVVRNIVGRRIAETPGVIVVEESSCDQPLTVQVVEARGDQRIAEEFLEFRTTGETPDGWRLGDIFSQMRHAGNLGRGFYQFWNPRPPQWYIDARNAWKGHVEQRIESSKRSGRPIDREGVVAKLDHALPVYQAWKAAKIRFGRPNVEVQTISLSVIAWAVEWLRINGPALVWVTERWVGQRLALASDVPFFGAKGRTSSGYRIKNHSPEKSAILSANANRRGRNLQSWNRGLVLGLEPSAERNEQLIGRWHRYGQERPCSVTYAVTCAEDLVALEKMLSEAKHAQAIGRIQQKILSARWQWDISDALVDPRQIPDIASRSKWTRRGAAT